MSQLGASIIDASFLHLSVKHWLGVNKIVTSQLHTIMHSVVWILSQLRFDLHRFTYLLEYYAIKWYCTKFRIRALHTFEWQSDSLNWIVCDYIFSSSHTSISHICCFFRTNQGRGTEQNCCYKVMYMSNYFKWSNQLN